MLADTVTRGAPVTAVMGTLDEVDGHPREEVTGTLMHVRIDAVRRVKDIVRYSGVVYDDTTSLPLRIDFQPIDGRIRMDAAVPGADAVAIHLDWRPATVGIAPALPERNLRERRLLGRPHRRRAAGLHLGARHRRVDRRRCRCRAPSTCARTAGSPCTCGLPGPWSPSRTPRATP